MTATTYVTFVHGYEDLELDIAKRDLPALWRVNGADSGFHCYPFPRNVSDFHDYRDRIAGIMPLADAEDFRRLPRFGLTGCALHGAYIYAGSWNAVYEIRKSDLGLNRIISNQLMNDLHGIWVGDGLILTMLTGKDALVMTDMAGAIVDHFCVGRDLTLFRDDRLEDVDWRFVSKQFRGATGYWHFNYVQRIDDEIWLTSRNAGAFVVVNPKRRTATMRMMNHKTPVLLHDGRLVDGKFYFTSIDGKVIICEPAERASHNPREAVEQIHLYNRDLVSREIRLSDTEFGREPNWCRGIDCDGEVIYVTVDGRYDSDLSFGLLGFEADGRVHVEHRLRWSEIGDERQIRYVTGFDVAVDRQGS